MIDQAPEKIIVQKGHWLYFFCLLEWLLSPESQCPKRAAQGQRQAGGMISQA